MKFKVVHKNGTVFTASQGYVSLSHLYDNAWMHENAVLCDNAIVATSSIDYIIPITESEQAGKEENHEDKIR